MSGINRVRQELHELAELSGNEIKTSSYILSYISKNKPDLILQDESKCGLIALFKNSPDKSFIAFRADIDAIPFNNQAEHLCGHDGHTAILLGLSDFLKNREFFKENIVLIFQPSEETGQGALKMLKLLESNHIMVEKIYGFHNLPGFKENDIIIKNNTFACASNGLKVSFKGILSHASEPEKGNNPVQAFNRLIAYVIELNRQAPVEDYYLITTVYAKLGDLNFGISPDQAVLGFTIRSAFSSDLDIINDLIINYSRLLAVEYGLEFSYELIDEFPDTVNDSDLLMQFKSLLAANRIDFHEIEEAFRWSEDFGHYLNHYPGVFFGIGSGTDHPNLHNPKYQFNDMIIEKAISVLRILIDN